MPTPVWNLVERKLGVPFPIPKPSAFSKLRRAISEADVVLIHDCLYLSNIATFILARQRGIPIILLQHIGHVTYKNPLLSGLMKLANFTFAQPMLEGSRYL